MVRPPASHQCGRGSNPGVNAICGLSLLLVLSFAPRGFCPGTPVFPSPQKPTSQNSKSTRNQLDEEPLCGCATSNHYLFIYYLFTLAIWTSEVKKLLGLFSSPALSSNPYFLFDCIWLLLLLRRLLMTLKFRPGP